jgi:transglutaminase-like putative cysteine protease
LPPDPAQAAPLPAGLPPPRAAGASCRERTAAWLAEAARAGFSGRTAVGVAWDGGDFVWHAWAEVRAGGRWIAVDPSFGEAPARGPRFTLGRWAADDRGARDAAGQAILACWGASRVE